MIPLPRATVGLPAAVPDDWRQVRPDALWLLCDLDGTLSDCRHRVHHARSTPPEWDAFNAKLADDPVVAPVLWLLTAWHLLGPVARIALVTARFARYRQETVAWCDAHEVPYDELHMRPDGDYRPDLEVKRAVLEGPMAGRRIAFALDDRDRVVGMYRAHGIACFQVAEGGY